MWKIWLFFSVFKFSFSAPVDSEDSVATGNLDGLRCLLLASPFASCDDIKRYGNNIPRRLQQLYSKVKKPFTEVKNDDLMDANSWDLMPTSLLYLTPRVRFQKMTGHTAGSILKRSPDDEALAIKLTSILSTDSDRQAFLEMLPLELADNGGVRLSQGVERELGRALAAWYPTSADWQYWQFDIALTAGSPVLAYLPSAFLNRMPHAVAEKFLFHLRNWQPDYPDTPLVWAHHSNYVKRIWTHTALRKLDRPQLWFPGVMRYASYLLLGATPDEIPVITSYVRDPAQAVPLLALDFGPLQARELFDAAVSNFTAYCDVKHVRQLVKHMLPRQIQQFDVAVELPEGGSSLPVRSQLLQHKISRLVGEKIFKSFEVGSWMGNVSCLGAEVSLLPASVLEVFKDRVLNMTTLNQISSQDLTFRQARYLTNNSKIVRFDRPETILKAKYHLKALPASLLNDQRSDQLLDIVKRHLLRYVPGKSRALTAMVLEKTHLDIDDRPFLTALLQNDDHEDILRLLSSRDVEMRSKNFSDSFYAIAQENEQLARKIRALPHNVGATLLAVFRRDIAGTADGWTMENLIEAPSHPLLKFLISNLQCVDIDLINDVDVVPILGHYVRERKALGMVFPKNMQYCCQKALTRYLKLKSSLRYWSDDSSGLLNLLELFEVRAVGGYILSSLPLDVIQNSVLRHHIISEIGSLRLSELMIATSAANLRQLTSGKHPRELHLRDMQELGNLIWFLSLEDARKINPVHFKLFLEMREDGDRQAPCFTAVEREFWRELFIQVLGKPSTWSPGALALLGDLLYVFDETDLETVSASARAEAADILAKSTMFHYKVEWPGKFEQITYYESCIETLPDLERPSYKTAVRTLIRFYLESAHMIMTTVLPAQELTQIDQPDEDASLEVESAENALDGRIKRSITTSTTKRGRIFKRVLNHDPMSSAESKKNDLLANGSRALVLVETDGTAVHVSETFPRKSMRIGCGAVRMVGKAAAIVLDEGDVKGMSDEELEDCAELLGSVDLPVHVRKAIWPRLSKWKESNNLLEVGNLVSVMDDDAIMALSLDISQPWSLESLAVLSDHITNQDSLSLVADRFILGNPTIMSSLRFGTAAALGPIVCKLIHSRQQKLMDNPNVFLQLAPLIGAAKNVDAYCISHMIDHARLAYGPPSGWSAEDVASLGVIVAGLKTTDALKASALAGITPAAVAQIPPDVFKGLSEQQLARLPALSVAAISQAQSLSLSPAQSEILERVRRQIPDKDLGVAHASSASRRILSVSSFVMLLTAVCLVV